MALKSLDDDERSNLSIGRQGMTNIVNEPGLFALIQRSSKPQAKEFKQRIAHDVMLEICKVGCHIKSV